MKFEKLQVGKVVWSVERRKMGNTTHGTTSVFGVCIKEIDPERRWVLASWNGNPPQKFYSRSISKWREKRPRLITSAMGSQRLATRKEIKALKEAEKDVE
jgi:hypothetical protein